MCASRRREGGREECIILSVKKNFLLLPSPFPSPSISFRKKKARSASRNSTPKRKRKKIAEQGGRMLKSHILDRFFSSSSSSQFFCVAALVVRETEKKNFEMRSKERRSVGVSLSPSQLLFRPFSFSFHFPLLPYSKQMINELASMSFSVSSFPFFFSDLSLASGDAHSVLFFLFLLKFLYGKERESSPVSKT